MVRVTGGEPEARVPFDQFPGEPRNSDLILRAEDEHGPLAIPIEAKGHESFGPYVGDAAADALERRLANPPSNAIRRIEQLVAALLSPRSRGVPHLRKIRYQLLTGVAGALAWARMCHASRAVFLIPEFRTAQTDDVLQEANEKDLRNFLHRLTGIPNASVTNQALGPFATTGAPLFDIPARLYIENIRTDTRAP